MAKLERRTGKHNPRADAAKRLRAAILALAGESDADVLQDGSAIDAAYRHRQAEIERYRYRFEELMLRHGHVGNLDVELQNDDGRVIATTRELFAFTDPWRPTRGLSGWTLSLLMGGTRGFRLEGGPGHWKVILGGPGTNRGDVTIADALQRPTPKPVPLARPRPQKRHAKR
jgi:hypothetical protein